MKLCTLDVHTLIVQTRNSGGTHMKLHTAYANIHTRQICAHTSMTQQYPHLKGKVITQTSLLKHKTMQAMCENKIIRVKW